MIASRPWAERGQDQQHGGGVVVGDQGVLGAGQPAQQVGDQAVARAALAGVEVVLQVGVALASLARRLQGRRAERRAAEIGVDDDARGVQDRLQARRVASRDALVRPGSGRSPECTASRRRSVARRASSSTSRAACTASSRGRAPARVAQQPIDARQVARRHAWPRKAILRRSSADQSFSELASTASRTRTMPRPTADRASSRRTRYSARHEEDSSLRSE